MREIDHQMVVPSYLMRVREGWTSVNDMFEEVQSLRVGRAARRPLRPAALSIGAGAGAADAARRAPRDRLSAAPA